MNTIQDFMNGATAGQRDPHFTAELEIDLYNLIRKITEDPHFTAELEMIDDYGFAAAVKVTCKMGGFTTSQIVSREEIETIKMPASRFGSQIRRVLWEQITKMSRD